MPKLYYYTWIQENVNDNSPTDDDLLQNPHWEDLKTQLNDQVFVFNGFKGDGTDKKKTENLDKQNIAVVKREFKLLNLEKKNKMVDKQVENINNGKKGAQNKRTEGIVKLDEMIISDFLRYLDRMYWEDKSKGIRSTISFDDAFDLVKPIFQDLINVSATIIDDTYNNKITDKEVQDAVKRADLKQEQITSDGVVKKSRKKNK